MLCSLILCIGSSVKISYVLYVHVNVFDLQILILFDVLIQTQSKDLIDLIKTMFFPNFDVVD